MTDTHESATILLVDSDEAQLARCRRGLGQRYQIKEAHTLAEAEQILDRETPDLLVLPLLEQVGTTYEFCRNLQSDPRTVELPVLLSHEDYRGVDDEALLDCGITDFIGRPIRCEEFRARARNLLELAKLRGVRHYDTFIDQDTGIGNRARFMQMLRLEWLRNRRALSPLSVLVAVRDRADGRAASVVELARVATLMEANLRRAGDVACRIDDNQFACVLPNTDVEGAQAVTTALYRLLEEFSEPGDGVEEYNLRVGTASVIPHQPLTDEDLFAAALAALEAAADEGWNGRCSLELDDDAELDDDEDEIEAA